MIKLVTSPILKPYLYRNFFKISVYEGISPALLATMSLSQGVKGTNNDELITSLVKGNIIRNATLQRVLKRLDRKDFIPDHLNKKTNYYQNKPYKISGGQNMTDIFTHAVILEQLATHLQHMLEKQRQKAVHQFTVLDIGTGHGYLAFAISSILNQILQTKGLNISHRVLAIDSNLPAIEYCNQLKRTFNSRSLPGIDHIEFCSQSLENILNRNNNSYDLVVGGFYMPPSFHEGLLGTIKQSSQSKGRTSLGIWSSDSSNGQSLYSFVATQNGTKLTKNQIMSTMFSMPTVKSAVSKYFVEDSEKQGEHQTESSSAVNEEQLRQKLKLLKIQRKKMEKEKTKQNLKLAIEKHSNLRKKKLTLADMKEIAQIRQLLEQLNKK